ncbi:unnamed protein product [Mytilus edulis]|uniref:Uncharacterized protein n=1 Tax=Mytilus edulis TaxID=6550 RepID=A0A8S3VHU4_MYTED|nr:unnamed protein product [Mytilus edulis]
MGGSKSRLLPIPREVIRTSFNRRINSGKGQGVSLYTVHHRKKRMSTTTANIQMSTPFIPQVVGFQQAPPVGRQYQAFPVRTFKVFGGVQIGLGVLLGILSLIGVILDIIAWNKYDDCRNNNYYYDGYNDHYWMCRRYNDGHALFAFDITCLICSGWYVVTGFLPMCMSKKREASWRCLKTGFMVCSIVGASVFVPTMFSLGVVGSIIVSNFVAYQLEMLNR